METECFICIDADGDYRTGECEETARDRYNQEVGGDSARRIVRVVLQIPLPKTFTLTGIVPNEGTAELSAIA